MQWFRSVHGAPTDSKLAVVARRANVTRGHAASVWWFVLDFASRAEERGSVAGIDPEEIAAAFDYEEEQVTAILDAMRHKSLLIGEDDTLTGWNKHQVRREDTGAASRKRKQRSRKKEEGPDLSHNVTQRPAPDKNRTDSDTEQKVERGARKRATRAPDDWEPSPETLEALQAERQDVDVGGEVAKYRDWSASSPNGAKLDHEAAFRNWIRRIPEKERDLPPFLDASKRPSRTQRMAESLGRVSGERP